MISLSLASSISLACQHKFLPSPSTAGCKRSTQHIHNTLTFSELYKKHGIDDIIIIILASNAYPPGYVHPRIEECPTQSAQATQKSSFLAISDRRCSSVEALFEF